MCGRYSSRAGAPHPAQPHGPSGRTDTHRSHQPPGQGNPCPEQAPAGFPGRRKNSLTTPPQPIPHAPPSLPFMAVLQPLPSFGIQYSPAPRKTGRRSPIAVSVEKAFDYSANGARVPLRVKLENTTGSDKKPLFNSMKGGTETGEPAILIRSSFRPGKAFMQSFTLSSPTISSTK